MVRTSPFHGGNMGSNPVGVTLKASYYLRGFLILNFYRIKKDGGKVTTILPSFYWILSGWERRKLSYNAYLFFLIYNP